MKVKLPDEMILSKYREVLRFLLNHGITTFGYNSTQLVYSVSLELEYADEDMGDKNRCGPYTYHGCNLIVDFGDNDEAAILFSLSF